MNNFEKIEAYFNNELSSSEKNEFLNEIESNSELKSEYNFQNDIINGIKEARKAELKAMLDKVPIDSTGTASTSLYKVFVGGAATILIGTSIWYDVNSDSEVSTSENKIEVVNEKIGRAHV